MTKQFGNLKLHFSKRGIAYKWGDGDIRRLSFGAKQAGPAQNADASPYDEGGPVYYTHAQDYDARYNAQGYDAEQDRYDQGEPHSGSYEFLYHTDWVMWALLVLLPPMGIWILWKRERFDPVIRSAISAASAIWFILLLIWLFSFMFGRGSDKVAAVTPGASPQVTTPASVSPTQVATDPGLDVVTPNTNPVTPADPSTNVPSGTTSDNSGSNAGDTSTASTDEVWATAAGPYYHKNQSCTNINGTPGKITLAVARSRGKTACSVCYADGGGTSTTTGGNYWATKAGDYYHTLKTCTGMKKAVAYTKAKATKEGKKACPTCIGSFYMTKTGRYYHKTATCSGMQKAQLVTKAQAKKANKPACPVCIGTAKTAIRYYASTGGTYYHTKSACTGMKNATRITLAQASAKNLKPCPTCVGKKTANATTYYSTTVGKYYHIKSNCSGMKGATKVTLTTVKKRGQKPCPTCIKTKSTATNTTTYYATAQGKYYHKTATCSGIKGAKKITLATAKKKGKTACPVCLAKSTQVKNTYVYTTQAGKYYHSKSNCSGMTGAKKTTLATAKKNGKKACPTCMKVSYYYTTTTNRYYHRTSGCSGMKNAAKVTLVSAKAKGKLACPVCVLKKASLADLKVATYVVSGGRYYHKNKTCNNMKNAKKVTLAFAKGSGRTACPKCVKKTTSTTSSADAKVTCYLLKSGTYYHSTRSCELIKGKKNIVKTSVKTAKKNDKKACPDCVGTKMKTYVYVMPTGLLYHRTPTCSGIKNPTKLALSTALNRAYKRCTKCNAPAAK